MLDANKSLVSVISLAQTLLGVEKDQNNSSITPILISEKVDFAVSLIANTDFADVDMAPSPGSRNVHESASPASVAVTKQ